MIDEKAVYLNDIILEVYGVTAAMAKKAGVELLIKKAISTPCIYGDNARIKQVLTILIGNFIKASKPGTTINLSVSQRLTGKDRVETAFCFSGMCRRLNSEFIESLIRHDKWHRDLGLGNDIDLEGTICGALIEKMNIFGRMR